MWPFQKYLNTLTNLKIKLIIIIRAAFQSDLCKKLNKKIKNDTSVSPKNNCFLKKIGYQLFLNGLYTQFTNQGRTLVGIIWNAHVS